RPAHFPQRRPADELVTGAVLVALRRAAGRQRVAALAARLDQGELGLAALLLRQRLLDGALGGRELGELVVARRVHVAAAEPHVVADRPPRRPDDAEAPVEARRRLLDQRPPAREDHVGLAVEVEQLQPRTGAAAQSGDPRRRPAAPPAPRLLFAGRPGLVLLPGAARRRLAAVAADGDDADPGLQAPKRHLQRGILAIPTAGVYHWR